MTTPLTPSTQVAYPWRTTLRTIVWLVVAFAVVVPGVWAIVQDELAKAGLSLPENVSAAVTAGVAVVAVILAIVQRVVLIPQVAAIIAKVPGLSPTPPALPAPAEPVGPTATGYSVIDGVRTTYWSDGSQTTGPDTTND
jgi:hypothetical protein